MDGTRVSLSEGWEVCYWTTELDASEEELLEAMRQVGPSVEAVRGYFRRQYQASNRSGPERRAIGRDDVIGYADDLSSAR